jgi:hypothetical protein
MSTNFDLEPSFCTPPLKEMITNPNPSVGNIHLKPNEVNRKCHIEDIEVSFPNKKLKYVAIEAPKIDLASNSRLEFMEVPKMDELNGAREIECNKKNLLPVKPHVNEELNVTNDTFMELEEETPNPNDEGEGNLELTNSPTNVQHLHDGDLQASKIGKKSLASKMKHGHSPSKSKHNPKRKPPHARQSTVPKTWSSQQV